MVEKQQLHVRKERARRLKERRRREQEANVARKRSEREQHKARCLAGMGAAGEQEEQEGASEEEDREWYVREVGEEPDPGMKKNGRASYCSMTPSLSRYLWF